MNLTFFNMKTQEQCTVEVEDNIFANAENDVKLIADGLTYELKIITPDSVLKLTKLRHEFELTGFELLKDKYNFKTRKDLPENFVEKFSEDLDVLLPEKYKEYYECIKDNKEVVYKTLAQDYITYILSMTQLNDVLEANKKLRQDDLYIIDYAKRFLNLLNPVTLSSYTLKSFADELKKIKQLMDLDDRRHAGYSLLWAGIGDVSDLVIKKLASDTGIAEVVLNPNDPKYGEMFKLVLRSLGESSKYYSKIVEHYSQDVLSGSDQAELDKKFNDAVKATVFKFFDDTNEFVISVSKCQNNSEMQSYRAQHLHDLRAFYSELNKIYALYDQMLLTFKREESKMMASLWEATQYYLQSNEGDWYLRLAELLLNSLEGMFPGNLTDEERAKYFKPSESKS